MKQITITKKQIIQAILKEKLAPKAWIHTSITQPDGTRKDVDRKTCPVCAVGSVLRGVLGDVQSYVARRNCNYFLGNAADTAWHGTNFLSILSTEFEAAGNELMADSGMFEDTRDEMFYEYWNHPQMQNLLRMLCLNVIEAACPEQIKVETI